MSFFDNLQQRIAALDEKSWYQYLAITGGLFLIIIGMILFFYYRSINRLENELATLNEQRQETKKILNKAVRVQKERAQVTALLEEDPYFKIQPHVQETLEKVGISMQNNVTVAKVVPTPREDNYLENVATYQLSGITMKQLTEFLNEINQNKRLFVKELEISRSKKIPRTIDVDIKIAAMMPKETA